MRRFVLLVLFLWPPSLLGQEAIPYSVGIAKIDITPDYPVRLSGFGFRRTESEGIRQRIWAKAIAISEKEQRPFILITTDNLGVPDEITQQLAKRLKIDPSHLAITATHTHTAPMLVGVAPTLFGMPIPADHQERINRYTR